MRRTIWRACGIALLGALGFGSAYTMAGYTMEGSATAAIPTTVTLPTVSVPTVSVPTLPVPTTVTLPPPLPTTTVTLPPPPTLPPVTPALPPVTLPPVTVPSVPLPTPSVPGVPAPSVPAPAAPAPNAPAQRPASPRPAAGSAGVAATGSPPTASAAGAPSYATGEYSPTPAAPSSSEGRDSRSVQPARFTVSRNRFTNRGKKRGATTLRFRLARAAKLILVVRGPGPSCAIAGRIAFRGREGVNRFRFNGRIAGRPLEPGTYQLTLRPKGRKTKLGRAVVTIVAPGATAATPTRILPQCSAAQPAPVASVAGTFDGPAAGDPGATDRQAEPTAQITEEAFSDREQPPLALLPGLQFIDEPHELPVVLGLAVLALLLVSLVGILVEVVRHLRSSHA